jgi:hypothetical protein
VNPLAVATEHVLEPVARRNDERRLGPAGPKGSDRPEQHGRQANMQNTITPGTCDTPSSHAPRTMIAIMADANSDKTMPKTQETCALWAMRMVTPLASRSMAIVPSARNGS